MYGLSDKLLNEIKNIKNKINKKIFIFGSRARGDYKESSDIDLAIMDEVSQKEKFVIMDEFDKINSEFKIDLIFIQNIENKKFLNSIKSEGKELWLDIRKDLKTLKKL